MAACVGRKFNIFVTFVLSCLCQSINSNILTSGSDHNATGTMTITTDHVSINSHTATRIPEDDSFIQDDDVSRRLTGPAPTTPKAISCAMSIKNERFVQLSPQLQLNGKQIGLAFIQISISPDGSNTEKLCEISTNVIMKEISFVHGIVQTYFILDCSFGTRLHLSDGNMTLEFKETLLMTLNIRRCLLDVSDAAKFGKIARLDTIIVQDTTMSISKQDDEYQSVVFPYLQSLIFVNSLRPVQVKALPLNTTFFSSIRKLSLRLVEVKQLPDYVTLNYPNLQSLTLISCHLREFPELSLNTDSMILPLGLSRTRAETIKNIQMGVSVSPDIKPRVLKLVYNKFPNISTLKLQGHLHSLVLNSNQIRYLGENNFQGLKGLQSIHLSGNIIQVLPKGIFHGLDNMIYLDLSYNVITALDSDVFRDLHNLLVLNLAANRLTCLQYDTFSALHKINGLHLGWNKLTSVQSGVLPFLSPNFSILTLEKNPLKFLTDELFTTNSLQHIDLSNTGIGLDVILNALQNTTLDKLLPPQNQLSKGKPVLRLRANNIRSIPKSVELGNISQAQIERIQKLFFVLDRFCTDLSGNSLNCNCDVGLVLMLLARSQTHYCPKGKGPVPLQWDSCYSGWTCSTPTEFHAKSLSTVDPHNLCCALNISECPEECVCKMDFNSSLIVDCSHRLLNSIPSTFPEETTEIFLHNNNITDVPIHFTRGLTKLSALLLSNNSLEELPDNVLRDSPHLAVIHVDNNNLARLPHVFKMANFTDVTINNNPFLCDCENKWIKEWLLQQKNVVKDWQSVHCITMNNSLEIFVEAEDGILGCPPQSADDSAKIAAIAVVLIFALLVVITVCYFFPEIRALYFVFFKLRFCSQRLSPIKAFLIACDEDGEVMEKVHSNLKSYSICHSVTGINDFTVGFTTRENIIFGLENNTTTILVVSKHFFKNETCMEVVKLLSEKGGQESANVVLVFTKRTRSKHRGAPDNSFNAVRKQGQLLLEGRPLFRYLLIHAVFSVQKSTHVYSKAVNYTRQDSRVYNVGAEEITEQEQIQKKETFAFDVSVAYADSERGWVMSDIVPMLTAAGYRVGTPDKEFIPGHDHVENIEKLLIDSRQLIYILSASFAEDEWSTFMFRIATELNATRKTNYLCVVLSDDVSEHLIDGELQMYVKDHICLLKDHNVGLNLLRALHPPPSGNT